MSISGPVLTAVHTHAHRHCSFGRDAHSLTAQLGPTITIMLLICVAAAEARLFDITYTEFRCVLRGRGSGAHGLGSKEETDAPAPRPHFCLSLLLVLVAFCHDLRCNGLSLPRVSAAGLIS